MEQARKEAAIKGEVLYYSKNPCKKHGKVRRYVSTATCVVCQKASTKARAERIKKELAALRRV